MIDTEKMKALAAKLRGPIAKFDNTAAAYSESAQAIEDLLSELEAAQRERDELRAARIAYASEFAPDAEGFPETGNIHANIRKLKAELEAREADRRDQLTRLLTTIEKDSEWANPRAVDWTRGTLLATVKIALAQRQGEDHG
ncbi:hypothetical protein [Burkholderia cenocepacia]|uniref:hypothetical protein n=1 Tax=Burkholderia cenocepacia TaxID=95486 RepID=UPI001903924C|nr:hypothetical protein [Burkholderia cenocepacia]MBJ9895267.1 hypothetical protein [Burkholderia cenocepacia]MBJ9917629.1 hypothetical protein [Burkholderia cenocepacia]